mgnify:CR=1 FL=1
MLFHPAIYAQSNSFQIFLQATIKSICNGIQYHDRVWIQICNYRKSELSLSAISLQSIFPHPSKFIHGPFCEEMVLVLDCYKSHCKKSDLLPSNLTLLVFHQATNQIDKIDSILPKYTQNLVSNRKHFAWLKHNNLKTMVHYTINLQVDDISEHMEHQCTFSLFIWIFVWAVA